MLFHSLARRLSETHDALPVSRRGFLIGATVAGTSLVVGFAAAAEGPAAAGAINPFEAYVKIDPDNRVTVYSAHMDMGQGIYFGVATLVQDELDADWSKLSVVGGYGNTALYGNIAWGGTMEGTGGSTGTFSSWERYRNAGATARSMLIAAAAQAWNVPAADISAKKGVLSHKSGKSATYGEMAAAAAKLPVPQKVALKPAKERIYIGDSSLPRYDSGAKAAGRQEFTIDVHLPGMLTAVMIHPPRFGATLKSFDASKAKTVKGVVDVVAVPRGVAIVATGMWEAMQARAQVTADWDEKDVEGRSSADILAAYRQAADKGGEAVAASLGDVDAAFASGGKTVEARYEFPYLAHAALEPLNAVARMNADGTLEVWGGHQMPDIYQAAAAKVAGIAPEKVVLHVMKTGGGFGRRAVPDADIIVEAVSIAKAIGWKAPVKVQWTREDDMRGGRYRPAYVHKLKAVFDKDDALVGLHATIVGQSIMKGTPFAAGMVKNGVDATSVEGMANQPYAIPNFRVDLTSPDSKVPVLWWRSVGSSHTAYALECFMDELAEAAGKDPLAFRLALLDQKPRHAAVLRLAAEKAGWGKELPAGHAHGLALAESFKTYVAQVAEVSLDPDGGVRVHRVTCAVDCGVAVNPDQVKAQMEGGIGFGLGAILKSQITLELGKVAQGNFDSYRVLALNEMPQVDVFIVPSDEHPTGVGEPGVPPIGPAVANAAYRLMKKRIRSLPFAKA